MQSKRMNVDEAIELAINNLNSIQIPIALTSSVGIQILDSIAILSKCVEALRGDDNSSSDNISEFPIEAVKEDEVSDDGVAVETRPIIEG